MAIFGKNWQFWVFDRKIPKAAMNLTNFWYGSCSYGLLWENHTLCARKILIWQSFGHLSQFLPVCWCLFDNFCFLNQVYGLRRDKKSLVCDNFFLLILFYYLSIIIIIIITAFRLATSAFMFLFIWPPPRDPSIACLF